MAAISRNGGWAQYMAEHGIPTDGPPAAPPLPHKLGDLLAAWHDEQYDCYSREEILEEAEHAYQAEQCRAAARNAITRLRLAAATIEAVFPDASSLRVWAEQAAPERDRRQRLDRAVVQVIKQRGFLAQAVSDLIGCLAELAK